jgi:hypothetical protein
MVIKLSREGEGEGKLERIFSAKERVRGIPVPTNNLEFFRIE